MPNPVAIANIDSRIIGESEADGIEVEEVDAKIAAEQAGLDAEDIDIFRARTSVGRFVSAGMSGYVVGESLKYQRMLDKAGEALVRELENAKTPEAKIRISDALARLTQSVMMTSAIQLKAVEIIAQGKKKKNRQNNAPQTINGTAVFAENVQVNGQAP